MKYLNLIFLITILFLNDLYATTFTWGSNLAKTDTLLSGEIIITNGDTLIIKPGTTVLCDSSFQLTVSNNAVFKAFGTKTDSVFFVNNLLGTSENVSFNPKGLYFDNAKQCVLRYCSIQNMKKLNGGGIFVDNTELLIEYSDISLNRATSKGGGIFIGNQTFPTKISKSTIAGNTIIVTGQKNQNKDLIYNGGGIFVGNLMAKLSINKNLIAFNKVGNISSIPLQPTGEIIKGGGIYIESNSSMPGMFSIKNNIINNNEACLYAFGNEPTNSSGGGIFVDLALSGNDSIVNNTIVLNVANNDSINAGAGMNLNNQAGIIVKNNIVYNNRINPLLLSPLHNINDIVGEEASNLEYNYTSTDFIHPLFINPPTVMNSADGIYWGTKIFSRAKFLAYTHNFDYHLSPFSPCIDGGDPTMMSIEPDGSIINQGAYGNTLQAAFHPSDLPPGMNITLPPNHCYIIDALKRSEFDYIQIESNSRVYVKNGDIYVNQFVVNGERDDAGITRFHKLVEEDGKSGTPLNLHIGDKFSCIGADIRQMNVLADNCSQFIMQYSNLQRDLLDTNLINIGIDININIGEFALYKNFILNYANGINVSPVVKGKGEIGINNNIFANDSLYSNGYSTGIRAVNLSTSVISGNFIKNFNKGIKVGASGKSKLRASGRISNNSVDFTGSFSSKERNASLIGIEVQNMDFRASGRISNNSVDFTGSFSSKGRSAELIGIKLQNVNMGRASGRISNNSVDFTGSFSSKNRAILNKTGILVQSCSGVVADNDISFSFSDNFESSYIGMKILDCNSELQVDSTIIRNANTGFFIANSYGLYDRNVITVDRGSIRKRVGFKLINSYGDIFQNTLFRIDTAFVGISSKKYPKQRGENRVINNIFYKNSEQGSSLLALYENSVMLYHNDINGIYEGNISAEEGNINEYPIFLDTLHAQSPKYLKLSKELASPCIDTGYLIEGYHIPGFPTLGNYNGEAPDIGAYETYDDSGVSDNNKITEWKLYQNYPNPFNPETTIKYAVPGGYNDKISLAVFNAKGEKVWEYLSNNEKEGLHTVQFNGGKFASGFYYYRLKGIGFVLTKKMIMIK